MLHVALLCNFGICLMERDQLEIKVASRRVLEAAKVPSTRELLARFRKFRGRLPATFNLIGSKRMTGADS